VHFLLPPSILQKIEGSGIQTRSRNNGFCEFPSHSSHRFRNKDATLILFLTPEATQALIWLSPPSLPFASLYRPSPSVPAL